MTLCGSKTKIKSTMKHIFNLLFIALLLIGCDEYNYLEDQGFEVEELPGYVAFNAPGASAFLDDEEVAEDDGSVSLSVEVPTGSLSDVTVNYEFSGSAVFGTDFTVEGASAAGGSVVIVLDKANFTSFQNADIDITLLTDDVVDGQKTLTLTLTSAQNASGDTFAVGRGGTDLLRTANVIISDIDE